MGLLKRNITPYDTFLFRSAARPNQPIETLVFPESGIVSVVMTAENQHRIEIGIVGREGMTDGSVLVGIDRIPHEVFVQVAGAGQRVDTATLLQFADERPDIRGLLLRWVHVSSLQTAQTALANGAYTIEERLARF